MQTGYVRLIISLPQEEATKFEEEFSATLAGENLRIHLSHEYYIDKTSKIEIIQTTPKASVFLHMELARNLMYLMDIRDDIIVSIEMHKWPLSE